MPPPIRAAADVGVSYRPLAEHDLAFIAELYISTRQEEIAATGWPPATQSAFLLQQHRAQHAHYASQYPDAERLIIERDGVAIGRMYLREDPDRFHVIDISLMPSSRGIGIGTAILTDVLHFARLVGKPTSLHVEGTNPANSLYRRLGFQLVAEGGVYNELEAGA